jgi:hypothetical protein
VKVAAFSSLACRPVSPGAMRRSTARWRHGLQPVSLISFNPEARLQLAHHKLKPVPLQPARLSFSAQRRIPVSILIRPTDRLRPAEPLRFAAKPVFATPLRRQSDQRFFYSSPRLGEAAERFLRGGEGHTGNGCHSEKRRPARSRTQRADARG